MKKIMCLTMLVILSVPAMTLAEEKTVVTPPLASSDYLSSVEIPLDAKEKKALQLSKETTKTDMQPYFVGNKLVYVHGIMQPTIIAAPLQVCDVELERGEVVNEIVVGDSARWMVEAGSAGEHTHLFIKPIDSGLESSAVITTDRRVYHLRLISKKTEHIPYIGFVYHDAIQRTAQQQKKQAEKNKEWASTTDADGRNVDLAKLNFSYEISGNTAWKPERVYDDGLKTYIQLPHIVTSGEMPVLLVRKGDTDVLVNYRVQESTMMVDGLFETIALVAGVGGDQESVEIRRMK